MTGPSRQRVVEALRASLLLGVLPDGVLDGLAARARFQRWETGESVFRRDDEGAGLFVVLAGRIKIVSFSPSGSEVILNVIEPGEVFGEMSLVDGEPRCADALAADASETVMVGRRDFLPVLDAHPEAARAMMAILCRRIRQTSAFVESAVLLSAPARLFLRIRGLAEQYGMREASGGLRIEHGFSQQELGESVGLTRVSVNKHLADWRRDGLIDHRQGVLVVHDLDALAARALGEAPPPPRAAALRPASV